MKKTLIGVLAAAILAIPTTAFAAQSPQTQTAAVVEADAAQNCCGVNAACCNVPGGSSCCN